MVIPADVSAPRASWHSPLGCVLSKVAYPVDCHTPRPLLQLVKKLG